MFMWHCIIIAETTVCVATGAEMAGKLTGKLNIFVCVMLTTMEFSTLINAILRTGSTRPPMQSSLKRTRTSTIQCLSWK